MLNLIDLTVQNFKSVGEETTVSFESLSPLTLILGTNFDVVDEDGLSGKSSNGSGKSTILDAILFSLFGRTLIQVPNRHLINRSIGSKLLTYCRLSFRIDSDLYVSEAYLSSKGKSDPTVGFRLSINGEKPIERNTPQMKEMIESQILGCPFDLFKSSVLISQSSYQNFYIMPKGQKMAHVEQLFQLIVFGKLLKLVRQDASLVRQQFQVSNSAVIRIGETIHDLDLKNDDFVANHKTKLDRFITAKGQIEAVLKKYGEALKPFSAMPDEAGLLEALDAAEHNKSHLRDSLAQCRQAEAVLVAKAETSNPKIADEMLAISCTKCRSKFEKLIQSAKGDGIDLIDSMEKLKNHAITMEEELKSWIADELKIKGNLSKLRSALSDKQKLETAIAIKENELKAIRAGIDELSSNNPYTTLLEKYRLQLDESRSELQKNSKALEEIALLELVLGDSGAKKKMLSDLVISINSTLNSYLAKFGSNYKIVFDSSFDFFFETAFGESEYDSFSSGEKQRINLATMLTFRDVIVGNRLQSNFFILDEVMDSGIDSVAIKGIVEVLGNMARLGGTKIAIISHNEAIASAVGNLSGFDGQSISEIHAIKANGKTIYEQR